VFITQFPTVTKQVFQPLNGRFRSED